MKGVIIMTEEKSGKKIAQFDLSYLSKSKEDIEEVLDILIGEARKEEKNIPWESIKKDLRKKRESCKQIC
ncbi:MAG: hypothetical protein SH857_14065 [Chitinophagales bacterium]|nr:hypothetical protein [Chitinophagales bacterium]